MKADPRFASFVDRIRNAKDGIGAVTEWTAGADRRGSRRGLVRAPDSVRAGAGIRAVDDDPQLTARGMLACAEHPKLGEVACPDFNQVRRRPEPNVEAGRKWPSTPRKR